MVSTVFDPNEWLTAGTRTFSQVNGSEVRSYRTSGRRTVPTNPTLDEPGGLGKADGLGDIELLCDMAPLEIGNRVWVDRNRNGIQDPTEPPLAGVTVRLLDNNDAEIAVATTDGNGNYVFSNATGTSTAAFRYGQPITASTPYKIDIPSGQTGLSGMRLTADDMGTNDGVDSDGALVGLNGARKSFSTGLGGHNNHSYDFGYTPVYSLGNRVWDDTDNSGDINGTEAGINAVVVRLFRWNGSTLTAATNIGNAAVPNATTSAGGYYRFDELPAGDYVVVVDVDASSALSGLGSSTGTNQEANPNDDLDSNDNGLDTPMGSTDVVPNGIRSGVVTLGPTEPTTEADIASPNPAGEAPNAQSNLTVDFGFNTASVPSTSSSSSSSSTSTSTTSSTSTSTTAPASTTTSSSTSTTTPVASSSTLAPVSSSTTIDPGTTTTTDPTPSTTPSVATTTPPFIPVTTEAPKEPSVVPTTTSTEPTTTAAPTTSAVSTVAPPLTTPNSIPTTQAPRGPAINCQVFVDRNGNGMKDPNEEALPGVTLNVTDSDGRVVATVTTADDGRCLATVPGDGEYGVEVVAGVTAEYSFLSSERARVRVLSNTAMNSADFRVNQVSALALTGAGDSQRARGLIGFGAILLGWALVSAVRDQRR
jgi:hypothetical protein